VIISNTDRHIMEQTLTQLAPVAFDAVVVSEDVRSYKPDTRNFTQALEACGAAPEEILHVAFGFKYDIAPAQEVGMQTAWVNRHREPPSGDVKPDHEWRDLWGLAEYAEAQAS
jgi:FMN phosphatase YigB (HAD superfamily)